MIKWIKCNRCPLLKTFIESTPYCYLKSKIIKGGTNYYSCDCHLIKMEIKCKEKERFIFRPKEVKKCPA